ncbi:ATP-binding protein [Kribbella ginsengisoli]|uniref:HTH luxR-type domain-containing protein n=1 Tax=Kribbella ginsengisoli TaxID=363865 RepID=A0ABP6YDV3_9ACTN
MTDREQVVLDLVAGHLTNAEIADRLSISARTVESHVSSLIRKLEVADRRGLARRVAEIGLLGSQLHGRWPSPSGGFLGREAEMAALTELLSRRRMVTVAGPGGVGKTRLATQAVQRLTDEPTKDGWFVDLSQISDPRAVTAAVAAAVGVVEHPGYSVEDALSAVLARADGVLVLDNCEHLIAAVETCVRRLVNDCPGLTMVATSRQRLGAAYEWVYELPGLSQSDAVLLFRARAEAAGGVVPEDRRVAALCARLEGMALAIELAAARYPSLGLDGLTAALGDPLRLLGSDEGTRQRSLRATITWSVDLLSPDERAVFAACSVFASRFTVADAHTVAWPDRSEAEIARLLAIVADQHLLRVEIGTPTRYRFQEVVRQYATELLDDQGPVVEQRHAQWAQDTLTSLAMTEHDEEWCEAFDRLAVEVRVVLGRGVRGTEFGERFAEELVQRGRLEEAQHVFEELAAADVSDRVRLLRLAAGAAAARLVGDETMRLLDAAYEAALAVECDEAAADALGWSVIYATMAPGIMANPPAREVTEHRLAEAERRAPAGSPADATVMVASAAWLSDGDSEAESLGLRAADRAAAIGLPVAASAALDRVCGSRLHRRKYADALAAVTARGKLMDPLRLEASTAYAFNDYLLMGCEVSLSAGDLPGAAAYAERLISLPCYRDYVHPALARQLEVDVLAGDFAQAIRRGERFRTSWEQAGRHHASTLAVGTYALALAHGLLGNDTEREEWRTITKHLLVGRPLSLDGVETGWAPTLDAWLLLDSGEPEAARATLAVDLDHPLWSAWGTSLWRPWYAAAWAEAGALTQAPDLEQRLSSATAATHDNPVAAALVRRAAALATDDLEAVGELVTTFAELGATYQQRRSLQLAR